MIRKSTCQASAFNSQNKVNTVYKAAKLVLMPLDKDSIKDCMTIILFQFHIHSKHGIDWQQQLLSDYNCEGSCS